MEFFYSATWEVLGLSTDNQVASTVLCFMVRAYIIATMYMLIRTYVRSKKYQESGCLHTEILYYVRVRVEFLCVLS